MKLNTTITASLTAISFAVVGCEEKKTTNDSSNSKKDAHAGHDHSGHDHGDHAAHDHGDHAGHDHGDHHGHDHVKKIAGPNGGKVITSIEPHAEFFVTADRKVQITFLSEDNKAIAVASQTVDVVCGDRNAPTNLTFAKAADGKSLLSASALPAGNNFPTIVTFRSKAGADPVRAKFTLNMTQCGSCAHKEYACTCDHAH